MRPLEGVTVVALEHVIAGPFCTRQLADLGARIIKIERPGVGDPSRAYDDRVRGMSSHFVWTNRSKESITLDLKQDAARRIVHQLLERADVLVQNLAPGDLWAHAQLRARTLGERRYAGWKDQGDAATLGYDACAIAKLHAERVI
jgi:crotonobetainyl-CoA:carnitine CoA-transferase CaiB-like acyl-CoA transferase